MDIKSNNQHYVTPAPMPTTARKGPAGSQPVFKTPIAITVARGFQLFLGFLILVLAGLLIHGLALDAIVFALVCGLFTLITTTYALVVEKAPSCHGAYNYWAIMSLDLFMAILWLSSMGANAALRATFVVSVNADCWNDGSAVNSGHCIVSKRSAVATQAGLAEMSAVAGLSALQMLLFIATLAHLAHQVRLHLQAKKTTAPDNATVEMKAQSQPMLNQQMAPSPAPVYPQYTGQQHYTSPAQPYQQQPTPGYDSYTYPQGNAGYQQAHSQTPSHTPSQAPFEPSHYHELQQPQQQQSHVYGPAATPVQQPYQQPPQLP